MTDDTPIKPVRASTLALLAMAAGAGLPRQRGFDGPRYVIGPATKQRKKHRKAQRKARRRNRR
jgi:hypothetical protein